MNTTLLANKQLHLIFAFTSLCVFTCPSTASTSDTELSEILASWVQYVNGGVEARVITTGKCPVLLLDDKSVRSVQRAAPSETHKNTVCTAKIPAGTKSIQLGETILPAPVTGTPQRIAILGDTGCRVSAKHGAYQACNNSSIWPFEHVAKSVQHARPELIIYTGDYVYRESPCPNGNAGCKNTPFGDTQKTWLADWIIPSKALRAAAPLIFTRGNHENCSRAGHGWFRYLDAHPYSESQLCVTTTEPWLMESGDFRIAVLDTSVVKDAQKKPLTTLFSHQLTKINALLSKPGWVLTHRPFWGYGADDDTGEPFKATAILQEAAEKAGLSDNVKLLIAGHIHLAEVLSFNGDRPPQLIVGNGGTQLIPETKAPEKIDDMLITHSQAFYQYGFAIMESSEDNQWNIFFRDIKGRTITTCMFMHKTITCVDSSVF